MSSTSLIGAQEAPGYNLVNGKFVEATYSVSPSLGGAAGGLQSTGHDLLLFAAALAKGTLLSPKMRQAMQTFVPGENLSQFGVVHSYGLGLERYSNQAITVYGHLGISAAHSSFFGYDHDPLRGQRAAVVRAAAITPEPVAGLPGTASTAEDARLVRKERADCADLPQDACAQINCSARQRCQPVSQSVSQNQHGFRRVGA